MSESRACRFRPSTLLDEGLSMVRKELEALAVGELLSFLEKSSETKKGRGDEAPAVKSGASQQPRLIPVTEWNAHHSWPPLGGLRWLIFNERSNGFHAVIRRVGRRVLIDEAAFFEWVKSSAEGSLPACPPTKVARLRR